MSEQMKCHLKICRALPGFTKEVSDDYCEDRFENGIDDINLIHEAITNRMRSVRSPAAMEEDMVFEVVTKDCHASYDLNTVTAAIKYFRKV